MPKIKKYKRHERKLILRDLVANLVTKTWIESKLPK